MAVGEPANKYQYDQYIAQKYREFKAWESKMREFDKRMQDPDRDDAYLIEIGYDDTIQDPDNFNLTDLGKFKSAIAGLMKICNVATGQDTAPSADDMTTWSRMFSSGMYN